MQFLLYILFADFLTASMKACPIDGTLGFQSAAICRATAADLPPLAANPRTYIMTTTSLLDAVRAEMRARLAVISSLYDLDQGIKEVSQMLDSVRDETARQREASPSNETLAPLTADLLTLDTFIQDLADRLLVHRRAVETALLGRGPAATNT